MGRYAAGEADPSIVVMAGHNSGESVEMPDSCLNNPSLSLADAPASFGRAVAQHNRIAVPSWLVPEATKLYLPPRADGLPACSPAGNGSTEVPRCCRVYEDLWQDLNNQCSEDVLFDAARTAAAAKGRPKPKMFAWRFDQVESCPPATSGWGGLGYGKLTNACKPSPAFERIVYSRAAVGPLPGAFPAALVPGPTSIPQSTLPGTSRVVHTSPRRLEATRCGCSCY